MRPRPTADGSFGEAGGFAPISDVMDVAPEEAETRMIKIQFAVVGTANEIMRCDGAMKMGIQGDAVVSPYQLCCVRFQVQVGHLFK